MQLDDLSTFASVTLAGSLAMERLVVIAKTWFPKLAQPVHPESGQSEYVADARRRRIVLGITIGASAITSLFIADGAHWYSSAVTAGPNTIPWFVFALMISGGSAFWTSVVGYASATKDVRTQVKADLIASTNARKLGAPASPSQVVPTL